MKIPVQNMKLSVLERKAGDPCLLTDRERLRLIAFLSSHTLKKFEWDIKFVDAEPLHVLHRAIAIGSSINDEFDFGFMLFKRIKKPDGNNVMESRSEPPIDIAPDIAPTSHPAPPTSPTAPPTSLPPSPEISM